MKGLITEHAKLQQNIGLGVPGSLVTYLIAYFRAVRRSPCQKLTQDTFETGKFGSSKTYLHH